MKKVRSKEMRLHCDYCDYELDDYQTKDMEKHEELHKLFNALKPGSPVKWEYTSTESDWGHDYQVTNIGKGIVVEKKGGKDPQVLVQTPGGGREWVDMYQLRKV